MRPPRPWIVASPQVRVNTRTTDSRRSGGRSWGERELHPRRRRHRGGGRCQLHLLRPTLGDRACQPRRDGREQRVHHRCELLQRGGVDAQHIYWSNGGLNTIGRANLDGTGVNQRFIIGANEPFGVVVDDARVSNQFSFGRVTRNTKTGVATLPVKVPRPRPTRASGCGGGADQAGGLPASGGEVDGQGDGSAKAAAGKARHHDGQSPGHLLPHRRLPEDQDQEDHAGQARLSHHCVSAVECPLGVPGGGPPTVEVAGRFAFALARSAR
jgi:hypothetical protein